MAHAPEPEPAPEPAPEPMLAPPPVLAPRRAGTSFEVPLNLTLDDHPYVSDHSLCSQPADWPHPEDLSPVLPLAMSMELMGELAMAQAPGMHVQRLGPMTAMSFISIGVPFRSTVKGFWKSENTVSLTIPGHLMIDVTLSDTYPEPPMDFVDKLMAEVGESAMPPMPADEQYRKYSFHGPRYQTCVEPLLYGAHGMHITAAKAEGKGSLIDQMGQCVGLYLHLFLPDNRVSFPVRVNDVTFYQDMQDQSGLFDCHCVIRKVSESFIQGDMVYLRDGKVWCIIKGWVNQRMSMPLDLWESVVHPASAALSEEVAPGVFIFRDTMPHPHARTFIHMRYLNLPDKDRGRAIGVPLAQIDFVAGRVAVRDAARSALRREGGPDLFPIEINVTYDEAGKPLLRHDDGTPFDPALETSLSHKDGIGAAIVSRQPVGIDVERIAEREDNAWASAFTPSEQETLTTLGDHDEWATRFWVAKEAYSKQVGTGLQGNPRQFVVDRVEGEDLFIRGVRIQTAKIDPEHILGWTADSERTQSHD